MGSTDTSGTEVFINFIFIYGFIPVPLCHSKEKLQDSEGCLGSDTRTIIVKTISSSTKTEKSVESSV